MKNISVLGLRVVKERSGRYDVEKLINEPAHCYKLVNEVFEMKDLTEEVLVLVTLDTKNKVTGLFQVSHGHLSGSVVHPREIFKRAIMNNAAFIMLVHNHPSGDCTPSIEDVEISRRVKEAGELLGIPLLDHIVIGDLYCSLKERGDI